MTSPKLIITPSDLIEQRPAPQSLASLLFSLPWHVFNQHTTDYYAWCSMLLLYTIYISTKYLVYLHSTLVVTSVTIVVTSWPHYHFLPHYLSQASRPAIGGWWLQRQTRQQDVPIYRNRKTVPLVLAIRGDWNSKKNASCQEKSEGVVVWELESFSLLVWTSTV